MASFTSLIFLVHAAQAVTSAYGLYCVYISGTNLLKYEDKAERAAKYSSTAEDQLHKTRVTQASGGAALALSLLTTLPSLLSTSVPSYPKLALNAANIATTLAARAHMARFWHGKAQVPFVGGYNEGIRYAGAVQRALAWLAASWALTSLMGAGWLAARG